MRPSDSVTRDKVTLEFIGGDNQNMLLGLGLIHSYFDTIRLGHLGKGYSIFTWKRQSKSAIRVSFLHGL